MPQEERRSPAPRRRSGGEGQAHTPGQPRRAPARRRRRRMGLGGAALYAMLVIGVSVILAGFAWMCASDVLSLNKPQHSATITIEEDTSVASVARMLKENDLIEYQLLFRLFAGLTGGKDDITAGTFTLNTQMDYRAIISNLGARSVSRATVSVTIPEGYTERQIFDLMASKGVTTVEKLNDAAANHPFKFSFLQEIPLGDPRRLEGYLFPDTYVFYQGEDPVSALNRLLLNFDARFTEEMRQAAVEGGQSVHEIITIASLIEKETTGEDQTTISSVIHNRLASTDYQRLQIDATVQYILPQRKEKLSIADTQIDDPYNTYVYPGLPKGPIANPGMASIRSAMNPAKTSYYFYALDDKGEHQFFQSYSKFEAFLAGLKKNG